MQKKEKPNCTIKFRVRSLWGSGILSRKTVYLNREKIALYETTNNLCFYHKGAKVKFAITLMNTMLLS